MKIDITEDRNIKLTEVFNSVIFETEEGEEIAVCMRDGAFEIGVKDNSAKCPDGKKSFAWYKASSAGIERLAIEAV